MSVTAEEYDDGYDDEEGGLSGFYVLAIFLAILAAFIVIVYFAYQKGLARSAQADGSLPVVAADPRPVRDEVALETPNTRREVYDRLDGVTPTIVLADADPARDPLDGYDQAPTSEVPASVSAPASAPAPASVAQRPEAVAPVEAEPRLEPQPARAASATPTTTMTAPDPVPAATQPAPAAATTATGTHVVQVGAFGSSDEAMGFYSTLSDKLGTLVSAKSPDVQAAEVKGRTYHRLRLGPFTSKDSAQSYCDGLKAKGQDCLVRGV